MSKPSSIRDGSSSPDPFITETKSKEEEATPTQELTQEEAQGKQSSVKTTNHVSVGAQVDAKDGGPTAWGGEDMSPPPPKLRRQSTSERSAQTTVAQVRHSVYMYEEFLLIEETLLFSKLTLPI